MNVHPGQYPPQYGQQPGQQPGQPYGQQPHGYPPGYPHGQAPQATPQGAPVANPRVQEALAQVDLLASEQVVYTLQADGFFLGSNPMLKLFAAIASMIVTLTGGYIRIFLIVTNQRVLFIKATQVWCGWGRVRGVNSIALPGIKEVGSTRETQACCINTRTIQIQSLTQRYNLVVKRIGDQEIRNFVTNLSAVIVANTSRASV